MCKGRSEEVHRLLQMAPDAPDFTDFREFQFKMFHSSVNKSREEIFVSPIALAANIGDYAMLDSILGYMKNIKVDEGLQARALNPPIQKTRSQRQVIRRKSPLQYACSLGLY